MLWLVSSLMRAVGASESTYVMRAASPLMRAVGAIESTYEGAGVCYTLRQYQTCWCRNITAFWLYRMKLLTVFASSLVLTLFASSLVLTCIPSFLFLVMFPMSKSADALGSGKGSEDQSPPKARKSSRAKKFSDQCSHQ